MYQLRLIFSELFFNYTGKKDHQSARTVFVCTHKKKMRFYTSIHK